MKINAIRLIPIIILLVTAGFITIKPDIAIKTADERAMQFHSRFLFSDSSQVAYYECDEFVSDALANYTLAMITREFSGLLYLSKEMIVNIHDDSVIDTIYTFSNNENTIQIYSSTQNEYLFTFEVKDSLFNLIGDVKTSMAKEEFSLKFHLTEPIVDKVQIANSEDTMRFMFYFENNRLKQISSYLYFD